MKVKLDPQGAWAKTHAKILKAEADFLRLQQAAVAEYVAEHGLPVRDMNRLRGMMELYGGDAVAAAFDMIADEADAIIAAEKKAAKKAERQAAKKTEPEPEKPRRKRQPEPEPEPAPRKRRAKDPEPEPEKPSRRKAAPAEDPEPPRRKKRDAEPEKPRARKQVDDDWDLEDEPPRKPVAAHVKDRKLVMPARRR